MMFAPKDTSGRVGESTLGCDGSEGECEGAGDVDGVDVDAVGECDLEDDGVDVVREDVDGERDGLDEESENPGRRELLPSPLSTPQVFL